VGVVVVVLILRRVMFPPDIADPFRSEFGLVGAICAVFGGVVGSTAEEI